MKMAQLRQYIKRNPITIVMGLGIFLFLLRSNIFHTDPKPPPAALPKVTIKEMTAETITTSIQLNGHTAEARRVTLKVKTPGRILSVPITKGQKVEPGQDLIIIDAEDRPARLEEARSRLNQRALEFQAGTKLEAKAFKAQNALAANKAELDSAKSSLAVIEQEIADTHIKAPFKSILEETFIEVGDVVNVGDKVATVIELDPLKIICDISEKDISRINQSTKAQVTLSSLDDKKLDAEVIYISKSADPKTRTYRVEMKARNPDMTIPAGLTARITFPTEKTNGYMISPATISLKDDGTIGVKLIEEEKVTFHPVQVVEARPDGLLISGLPEKISLIVIGGDFVIEGQKVITTLQPSTISEKTT
ncbi:MAG: efflux RND transporter periplasmic adaptor subunit [Alphaproteobacteria bacterium]|nr:efflux RND transporter periplasmic adaptor subunit [Alphaproteobacteria bacterium]